jgi:PPM family protein phosphatase
MGTTLTVALLIGDHAHIAQVGDSRAYLFNRSGLSADGALAAQLTNDHSLVARLVDIGQITAEEARSHPQRNLLYRSLGTDPTVDIDTYSQPLQEGDRLLLCSDGLTNHVEDAELAQIVLEHSAPDAICAKLVALANERGGRDNISVIVVQVSNAD